MDDIDNIDEFEAIPCSSFYGRRHATFESAIDYLEKKSSRVVVDIVLIPPNVDEQTDEEEFEEDDLVTTQLPSDVPGEIEIGCDSEEDEDDDIFLSVRADRERAKKPKIINPKWTQNIRDISMASTKGSSDRLKVLKEEIMILNMIEVFAWRLYTISHRAENVDLLTFQRNIVRHYLRSYAKAVQRRPTSSRPSGSIPRSILEDPHDHFPKKVEKQLRCRQCHSRVRWICEKCNVTLCIERGCFKIFHS